MINKEDRATLVAIFVAAGVSVVVKGNSIEAAGRRFYFSVANGREYISRVEEM